jgi:hypothetical protein
MDVNLAAGNSAAVFSAQPVTCVGMRAVRAYVRVGDAAPDGIRARLTMICGTTLVTGEWSEILPIFGSPERDSWTQVSAVVPEGAVSMLDLRVVFGGASNQVSFTGDVYVDHLFTE